MNQLMAKVKNKTKTIFKSYKKLLSEEECYELPNINSVEYNPNTLLEDGQWFSISNFSEQDFCLELFKLETFNSVDFEDIDGSDFGIIDYLCSIQDDVYYIQKIRPAQLVIKKRVNFGDSCTLNQNSKSLVINKYPDAIYNKVEDVLYFQRLETINSIFKGIDTLYKEATEEEVVEFLDNDFITLGNEFNSTKVSKPNRKRIAMAMDILNRFSPEEKTNIIEYTRLNAGLQYENESFVIKDEEDIKKLVWGITERYYETPISRERRIANSILNV